jgi:excisionase family DNA binding protein
MRIIAASMMKLKHAAKALSVSERFLRQLIAEGRIPFYRLSKRTLRVDLNELRDYMRLIAEGRPKVMEDEGDE